jgi:hypothetical protein
MATVAHLLTPVREEGQAGMSYRSFKFEIWIRGCSVCGDYVADYAATKQEAERLKVEVELSQDARCDGYVSIREI